MLARRDAVSHNQPSKKDNEPACALPRPHAMTPPSNLKAAASSSTASSPHAYYYDAGERQSVELMSRAMERALAAEEAEASARGEAESLRAQLVDFMRWGMGNEGTPMGWGGAS